MVACNFVWGRTVHPDFKKRIESGLADWLAQNSIIDQLCHDGVPEVNLAESMPMGHRLDAVIVCSCGVPRATIEGQRIGDDVWTFNAPMKICAEDPAR